MAKNRIVCFGEALIDFLNTDRRQEAPLMLDQFTQFPGGAPANVAVAVAKLGGDVAFAGQVGSDRFGTFLLDALSRYGVDTSLTLVHPTASTTLAFVFLDDDGERSFAFRRQKTADVLITREQIGEQGYSDASILHFCSNTLTDPDIAAVTRHVVEQSQAKNALVSFDVNLRHNLWPDGEADKALVNELVEMSALAKFSRDEIEYLSDGLEELYLARMFDAGLRAALITDGPREMSVCTAGSRSPVSPPSIDAVDTTGGGDAFIAAVLFGLSRQADPGSVLGDEARLAELVSFASHCGAIAVSRPGAFPAFPTFEDVADHWVEPS